jgi:hypothetical protein
MPRQSPRRGGNDTNRLDPQDHAGIGLMPMFEGIKLSRQAEGFRPDSGLVSGMGA